MGTLHVLFVCLVCGLTPAENSIHDEVDLVEINHFHDEKGRLVFDQIIFYDWCPVQHRYNVRDWRLLKSVGQIPLRDWRSGQFLAIWHDFKDKNVLRTIRAGSVRESWTQYDPELVEREFLAQEKRRELSKLIKRNQQTAEASATSGPAVAPGPAASSTTNGQTLPVRGTTPVASSTANRQARIADSDQDLPLPQDPAAITPR